MPPRSRAIPDGAITIELPNVKQQAMHTCGAAALLAVSSYYGVGPATEAAVARDMKMTRDGSDPAHLMRAVTKYGLEAREHRPMTSAELLASIDAKRPVIVMLQAWASPKLRTYAGHWRDGHWAVAIGYDDDVVYFADPMLDDMRGFIRRRELDRRWHDIEGPRKTKVDHFGLTVWRRRGRPANRIRRAVQIP